MISTLQRCDERSGNGVSCWHSYVLEVASNTVLLPMYNTLASFSLGTANLSEI